MTGLTTAVVPRARGLTARRRKAWAFSTMVTLAPVAVGAQEFRQNARPASSIEDVRISRLAGLGQAWGTLKFFHPYLAYKEVNWDEALITTIPRVNSARTAEDYAEAITHLLSFLNDRNTYVELLRETKPAKQAVVAVDTTRLVRVADSVFIVDAMLIARTLAQDNSSRNGLLARFESAVTRAKSVVIDMRSDEQVDDYASYELGVFIRDALPRLLTSDIKLGSTRHRIHNGYASQGAGYGGYYSGFMAAGPVTIAGRSKSKQLPIAVIINKNSPPLGEILTGLQGSGNGVILQEGSEGKEPGIRSFTMKLPDNVQIKMRTTELVNPDGTVGFQPDFLLRESASRDLAIAEAVKALQRNKTDRPAKPAATVVALRSTRDSPYPEMSFPSADYRLLGLFRFWNVINYFFPYKHLIEEPWAGVLPRYIPRLEANKDVVEYQLTLRELVAETHDSHVSVGGSTRAADWLGNFSPPIGVRYVGKQTVVTSLLSETTDVKIGDVILEVDGQPIERRREYLGRFISASTPQALERAVHRWLLRGQKDTDVALLVRGRDGKSRRATIPRSLSVEDPRFAAALRRTTPVVRILPEGFGYVDLARLQLGEVDKMFETINKTSATIFDLRGYPHGTAWDIAPRLTEKQEPVAAVFSRPFWDATSLGDEHELSSYTFAQKLPKAKGNIYRGKVVMLINEDAVSHSEHSGLFFEAATNVTFIGTPTVGANGDVTRMVLPGGLVVGFSGHDVRHADGRQLQRLGIQPHIKAEPTIRGIIEQRDEILEAAIAHLKKKPRK